VIFVAATDGKDQIRYIGTKDIDLLVAARAQPLRTEAELGFATIGVKRSSPNWVELNHSKACGQMSPGADRKCLARLASSYL